MNKKLRKVLEISLLIEIAIFSVLVTNKIIKVYDKQSKLENRIKQLEIDCKLYKYDIDSLHEYYNN